MIAVVVVAYRDPAALTRCLRALDAAYRFDRVIVVNVTADRSVRDAAAGFGVTVVDVARNCGYAAGINIGVSRLGDLRDDTWVLLLNDDVCVRRFPDLGGFPPQIVVPVHAAVGAPDLHPLPTPRRFFQHWVLGGAPRSEVCDDFLAAGLSANGAALVSPLGILREHRWPEQYFLYWEETSWFWTLFDAGISGYVARGFVVERTSGADEFAPHKAPLLTRNLVRLGRERRGGAGRILYGAMAAAWTLALAVSDLRRPNFGTRIRYRVLMGRGVIGGLVDD